MVKNNRKKNAPGRATVYWGTGAARWVATTLACCMPLQPLVAQQESTEDALRALLRQADYWQENERSDLARQALERYLQGRPNSTEVLYRLARQALLEERLEEAERYTAQLEALSPNDPRLIELDQIRQGRELNSEQLARARQLARAERYDEAAAAYRELFNQQAPPRGLAVEYYQTLAGGDDASWRQARDGLSRFYLDYPDDAAIERAYAEVLTYREGTRREGIERLAELAEAGGRESEAAQHSWRQGLLWLGATPADEQRYARYVQAFPEDSAVMAHFEAATQQNARMTGFNSLESNQTGDAESAFREALEEDANDAEAKAGLGIVMLRRQRFSEARQLLQEAMDSAPERRDEWMQAFQSASFFERLASARQQAERGELDAALSTVRPLTQQGGEQGRSASLLEADILRRQQRYQAAEQAYRQLLERTPNNVEARLGLVQVLSDQGDWEAAQRLAQGVPDSARERLSGIAAAQVAALREQARVSNPFAAEGVLRKAMAITPSDPWVRLDLARLMAEDGRIKEANTVMAPLEQSEATPEQRYAAALFASEQNEWPRVQRLLSGIALPSLTEPMRDLQRQARIQQPLQHVLSLLERGYHERAEVALEQLYTRDGAAELSPQAVAEVASALAEKGETEMAYRWVNRDLTRGVDASAAEAYLTHALVLAQAGDVLQARELLTRLQSEGDGVAPDALPDVRRGVAVMEADDLRRRELFAQAYDVLAPLLREAPDDEALLLALGRLYTDGGKPEQAEQIFTYTLTRHPESEPALSAAVQTALAGRRTRQAEQLLSRYARGDDDADRLWLKAQVAYAQGDTREALRLLGSARQRLTGSDAAVTGLVPGNPFRDSPLAAAEQQRPDWLPGGARASDTRGQNVASAPSLSEQIDALSREIRYERAPRLASDFTLQWRDGKAGLSQQERLETLVRVSAIPFGNGRFGVEVTPTVVEAGTPGGESANRFGSLALENANQQLSQALDTIPTIIDGIENSVTRFFQARADLEDGQGNPDLPDSELARLRAELEDAETAHQQSLARNPLYEGGLRVANLTEAQLAQLNQYLAAAGQAPIAFDELTLDGSSPEAFATSREVVQAALDELQTRLASARRGARPGTQRDAGAGLSLTYENDSLAMDVGSTPLGFEESHIVGGVTWRPALSDTTRLQLTAERREVKDSLLSYAGAYDESTGESWGGVVRTGGRLGVNYDDAGNGLYADVGAYRYEGKNVSDNTAYELALGGYVSPINNARRHLQTGVHLSAMAFDRDLSHFTFGHGGYFSPQQYTSIALPINYRDNLSDDVTFSGYVSPGYQYYRTDDSDYFPTDPEAQALLDVFTDLGTIPSSQYRGETNSGAGVSVGAALGYQASPALSLGGRVGYNSFGDYSDASASMFIDYSFGANR